MYVLTCVAVTVVVDSGVCVVVFGEGGGGDADAVVDVARCCVVAGFVVDGIVDDVAAVVVMRLC